MNQPETLDLDDIEALAARVTDDPFFVTDCEGKLAVWREKALTHVRRDEHGQIDMYSLPASYRSTDEVIEVIYLDSWDPGEDEVDDQRRQDINDLVDARALLPALVAEVRRLRALLPKPVIVPDKDTPLSDYDFVELVAFASKVESEGFGYAFEEYPPCFEAEQLAPIADDYSLLRQLFDEWEEALDEFWTRSDAEAVYDAHIDEARRRRREQRAASVVSSAAENGHHQ